MTGPAALNLQPSDLRLNAYRSLRGGQDAFFLLFQVFLSIGIIGLLHHLCPIHNENSLEQAGFKIKTCSNYKVAPDHALDTLAGSCAPADPILAESLYPPIA